jgi:hypothetical protein
MAPGPEELETGQAALLAILSHGNAKPLCESPAGTEAEIHGLVIGELLALSGDGIAPLVRVPRSTGSSVLPASTCVDLHGPHIGASVVLMFERGNPNRPIVLGVLRGRTGWATSDKPGHVEVDADGERMVVSAREQLVLRCGKASVTLTKAGKVVLSGTYICSKSSGVNQISGGSVHLN